MDFHPKPQVLPYIFNRRGFGPPSSVTSPSACSWLDHLVSGLIRRTQNALFRLAFATPPPYRLKLARQINSLTHYTKGTRSLFAKLPLFVGIRFQVSFTPLGGVLFTFPSRYWFA